MKSNAIDFIYFSFFGGGQRPSDFTDNLSHSCILTASNRLQVIIFCINSQV